MASTYHVAWWNVENLFDEENSPRRTEKVARVLGTSINGWTPALRDRTAVDDDTFLHFAGLFARRPPTAAGLELVLSGYFGWPVAVEQFAGQWLYLDAENRTQLGTADRPHGMNARLGHDG